MGIRKHKNAQNHFIGYEYNTKIKTYANNEKKITFHSYSNVKGYVTHNRNTSTLSEEEKEKGREYQRHKNLYKTKQNIIDLIYHNGLIQEWEYFVTLTFNPTEVDSLDYERVVEALSKWTDNMKHQNPNMSYVLVPELHPTSGRVHWHGVFRNVPNWKLVPARNKKTNKTIYKNGLKIYNLANYHYGFTTVSEIKNQEAVSVYCSKYITKNLIENSYKKRFWASRDLQRPTIEYAICENYSDLLFKIDKDKIKQEHISASETSLSAFIQCIG